MTKADGDHGDDAPEGSVPVTNHGGGGEAVPTGEAEAQPGEEIDLVAALALLLNCRPRC